MEKKQGCQNSSLYVQKTFWGNQVEWETYSFGYRSRTYSGIHSDFSWKKKTRMLSWLHSVSSWSFGGKLCFLRNIVFFSNQIRALTKVFGLFVTNSRDGCQNCILRSIGIFFRRKPIFGKFHSILISFGFWIDTFQTFGENISTGLPILFLKNPGELFEKNNVIKQAKSLCFLDCEQKTVGHWQKSFSCSLQTAYYVPWEALQKFFLNFDDLFCRIRTFQKKFWKLCRNCFLWAQKIVSREKKLQKFCFFFIIFRFDAKTFYFR